MSGKLGGGRGCGFAVAVATFLMAVVTCSVNFSDAYTGNPGFKALVDSVVRVAGPWGAKAVGAAATFGMAVAAGLVANFVWDRAQRWNWRERWMNRRSDSGVGADYRGDARAEGGGQGGELTHALDALTLPHRAVLRSILDAYDPREGGRVLLRAGDVVFDAGLPSVIDARRFVLSACDELVQRGLLSQRRGWEAPDDYNVEVHLGRLLPREMVEEVRAWLKDPLASAPAEGIVEGVEKGSGCREAIRNLSVPALQVLHQALAKYDQGSGTSVRLQVSELARTWAGTGEDVSLKLVKYACGELRAAGFVKRHSASAGKRGPSVTVHVADCLKERTSARAVREWCRELLVELGVWER